MRDTIRKRWTAALRSNEYQQGKGFLVSRPNHDRGLRYCCLGVLCNLAIEDGVKNLRLVDDGDGVHFEEYVGVYADGSVWDNDDVPAPDHDWMLPGEEDLPECVMEWAGLDHSNPDLGGRLASVWNDGEVDGVGVVLEPQPFAVIADKIDECLS
jgi:hypothetical protein